MQKPTFDPGLTQLYTGPLRRAVNQDGSFNVLRQGASRRDIHPYLRLVSTSWPRFFVWILAYYATVNFLFAIVYFLMGPGALQGGLTSNNVTEAFANEKRKIVLTRGGDLVHFLQPAPIR